MHHQEEQEFINILHGVYATYGKEINPIALPIWLEAFKPYELRELRQALQQHMMNPDGGQFPPKPADLNRYMVGNAQGLADVAWDKFIKAVQRIGPYKSICFDDPLIHAVAEGLGGWVYVAQQTTDKELPFVEKRFLERYRALLVRPPQSYPKHLVGITEQQNARDGLNVKLQIAYVGIKQVCESVWIGGTKQQGMQPILLEKPQFLLESPEQLVISPD